MKILLVSSTVPPSNSATATLISKLLPYFEKEHVSCDYLTIKSSYSESDKFQDEKTCVYRADCTFGASSQICCLKDLLYKVYRRLKRIANKSINNVYRIEHVNAYINALKKINLEKYSFIIAISAYYDPAFALAKYKEKYELKVPIALYQVDPLAENIIYCGGKDLLACEKHLYEVYDCIFTTPTIYNQKKALCWDMTKVETLMFPLQLSERTGASQNSREEIKCVYAGQLYGKLRDATYALELFSKIDDPRIQLYFVGRGQVDLLQEYEKGKLKGRLHYLGEKSSAECDEILTDADILINIGNSDKYLIPSKLFHYFGFCKPILNISTSPECPSIPYVNKYGLALNIVNDGYVEDSDINKVREWIFNSKDKQVEMKDVRDAFCSSSPEYIAQKIIHTMGLINN